MVNRSQSGGTIEEGPGQVEMLGEMFGESLDAEGFGGVMACIEDVQSQFIGQGSGPMGSFAGDEGVHAGPGGLAEFIAGAAGDDANTAADLGAAGEQEGILAHRSSEALGQFLAGKAKGGGGIGQTDLLPLGFEEGPESGQAEGAGEAGVVAQFGVGIEGKVGAVNRQLMADEEFDEGVAGAGPGMLSRPEQPMMHEEQVGAGGDGLLNRGQSGVHGGGNPGDLAGILHLETVARAVPILEAVRAEESIAVANNGIEGNTGHGREPIKGDGVRQGGSGLGEGAARVGGMGRMGRMRDSCGCWIASCGAVLMIPARCTRPIELRDE